MKTEPTMADFLNVCIKITEQTNFDAFLQYSGHVDLFSVQICEKQSPDFDRILDFNCKGKPENHLKQWILLNNFYNENKNK